MTSKRPATRWKTLSTEAVPGISLLVPPILKRGRQPEELTRPPIEVSEAKCEPFELCAYRSLGIVG
jgi:hypothetical protein